MNSKYCVYTTLQPLWLLEAMKLEPDENATFQSVHTWKSAGALLKEQQSVPLFIREGGGDENEPLKCTHVADLVSLRFSDTFITSKDRREWLERNLNIQKKYIKGNKDPKFDTWQDQFEEWELRFGDKANTWFSVKNVREIEPFPITRLIKVSNNEPLAENYSRGYSICYMPEKVVGQ